MLVARWESGVSEGTPMSGPCDAATNQLPHWSGCWAERPSVHSRASRSLQAELPELWETSDLWFLVEKATTLKL